MIKWYPVALQNFLINEWKVNSNSKLIKNFLFFGHTAWLARSVSWPGTEPRPTAVKVQFQALDNEGIPWRICQMSLMNFVILECLTMIMFYLASFLPVLRNKILEWVIPKGYQATSEGELRLRRAQQAAQPAAWPSLGRRHCGWPGSPFSPGYLGERAELLKKCLTTLGTQALMAERGLWSNTDWVLIQSLSIIISGTWGRPFNLTLGFSTLKWKF